MPEQVQTHGPQISLTTDAQTVRSQRKTPSEVLKAQLFLARPLLKPQSRTEAVFWREARGGPIWAGVRERTGRCNFSEALMQTRPAAAAASAPVPGQRRVAQFPSASC